MTSRDGAKNGPSRGTVVKKRKVSSPPDKTVPKTRPGFMDCPECGKEVKEKNLEPHLRRIHGMTVPEAEAYIEDMYEVEEKDTKGAAIYVLLAAVVLSVILVAVIYYFVLPSNQSGQSPTTATDYAPIEFSTSDGWVLHGDLYTANAWKPYLILVTSTNQDRTPYRPFAEDMHKKGYGILSYDTRGSGQSTVKNGKVVTKLSDEMVINSTRDIQAAIDTLGARNMTNNGVVIVGAALGANIAILVAKNDTRVKDLVLLSPSLNYNSVKPFRSLQLYTGGLYLIADKGDGMTYTSCLEFQGNATLAKPVNTLYPAGTLRGTPLLGQSGVQSKIEDWIINNA